MPPPTEDSLLTRYLLPPSSLPTIIPYCQFLLLLPSNLRSTITNDPHSPAAIQLKRFYQDLQFQRDIDVDTVTQNIQRECGRSEVLRGRLTREVAEELGIGASANLRQAGASGSIAVGGKKRKRGHDDENEGREETETETDSEEDSLKNSRPSEQDHNHATTQSPKLSHTNSTNNIKHDALHSETEVLIDELFSGPRGLTNPHPLSPSQQYHTPSSLLSSMRAALKSLTTEITDLDNESATILEALNETVGAMSDLRYGKFSRVGGHPDPDVEGGGGLEEETAEALESLNRALKQRIPGK